MYTYLGPVFSSTNDTYEKYDFEDIKEAPYQNKSLGGGLRLSNITFLSAWVPNQSWNTFIKQGIAIDRKDSRLDIPQEKVWLIMGTPFLQKIYCM